MSLLADLKILYHLALRPVRGQDHAQRMENFYAGQAEGYDDFRKRLLQGREEVYQRIAREAGGVWVDLGGGTGANLEFIGPAIANFKKVYVVDLASSLLKVVEKRAAARGGSGCGDLFLLADDDSRLVRRHRQRLAHLAAPGKVGGDRFLCRPKIPGFGVGQTWLEYPQFLAGLVLQR
jgi:hypothetical protein